MEAEVRDNYCLRRARRIEEDAEMVERAFEQFRAQQTTHGGTVTPKDKQELRRRLAKLDGELDYYLAGEYGAKVEKAKEFDAWKAGHEPFHWFIEFYGIMHAGGFDVIIGNPPYLERSKLSGAYTVRQFRTEACRDIYSWVVERTFHILAKRGRLGLIVPVSLASSGSFNVLRDIVHTQAHYLWLSHFANRPGQLFVGAQNRLTIILSCLAGEGNQHYCTRYHRWDARNGERESLFATMGYCPLGDLARDFHGLYPKVGAFEAAAVLRKLRSSRSLGEWLRKESKFPIYWVRVPGYFCQFFLDAPKARPENGGPARPRGELNTINAPDDTIQRVMHAILNSSTYFQFFCAYTDGRHINPSDVTEFPLDLAEFDANTTRRLVSLSKKLDSAMRANTSQWRKSGLLIDSVDSRPVKPILDEIEVVLGKHYRFTAEEVEFIINYDMKYRVGVGNDEGEE